jgi:hypothetical protein
MCQQSTRLNRIEIATRAFMTLTEPYPEHWKVWLAENSPDLYLEVLELEQSLHTVSREHSI